MIKGKIKKILVPLDGSKNSLKGLNKAIYLARQCGSTITGLHVVPIYPARFEEVLEPFKKEAFRLARIFLDDAKIISAKNGIVFDYKVIYGEARYDVADFANDKKFDLIVIGSRGFGKLKEIFLGSVANSVIHRSEIPVLIVK